MKILFFISVRGHGRGGHIYSLYHTANEIASRHQVGIVSIGTGDNTTISRHPNYSSHISFNGINLLGFKRKTDEIIEEFNPDIVHCFDASSFNIINLLYRSKSFKLALTRCGGPNPRAFPYVKNLILFSMENKKWFESNRRYKDTNIALIPNRVTKIATTPLDIVKPAGFFSFVKIARIGIAYKNSILDSIALIDTLYRLNKELKIKLFVIGVVECQEAFSEISRNKHVINGTVIILTDDKYTINASKMLYLADAAIATGRGVMEAASLGIPTLTINSQSNIPTLITKNIFGDAFKTNFSGRNVFPSLNDNKNISNIERLIIDDGFYKELSIYMSLIFKEEFDVKQASYKYEEFYSSITDSANRELLYDSALILKCLYYFFRSSRVKIS